MSKSLVCKGIAVLALLCLLAASPALGVGVVSGLVLDGATGLPIRGATLQVEGSDVVIQTDLNGVFQAQIDAGTWTLIVTSEGYEGTKVLGVDVVDGGAANVSIVLDRSADNSVADDASTVVEEITVTAEAIAATEAALLAERKAAAQIIDNIGSEEISKNNASDAAGALKRVTGISVQENKFIFVRGLGERYSNTMVNGSRIPTTEFERKTVPLDLFPSDLLEKVTVSKSYTVDQPGDFVAGVVQLETKQFPPQRRFSIGVSGTYNTETTGEDTLEYDGGLSFSGGGGQGLPSGFPEERIQRFNFFTQEGFTSEQLEQIGESLIGPWTPGSSSAPINQSFDLTYGNSWDRFGLVLSGTWGDSFTNRQEDRVYYATTGGNVIPRDTFAIDYGEQRVKRSLMGNFSLRASDSSQVRFRALMTNNGLAEARFQEGFFDDLERNILDQRVLYRSQDVENYQVSGDHFFSGLGGSGGSLLEWRGAVSAAETDENQREAIYVERNDQFQLSSQGKSGFIFINDLTDDLNDYRADWSMFFTRGEAFGTFKAGAALTQNDRDFDGRRLRFLGQRLTGIDTTASPEQIFTAENIRPRVIEISEVTNPTDSYVGTQDVPAGYVQGDWSFGKWRLIGGVRFEDSDLEVVTFDRSNPDEPAVTVIDDSDVLPALSAVYSINDRMTVRGSLSRTVNRPEYREIAPFSFVHLVGGYETFGNPDIQSATIDSVDVRWEWFPSAREVVAVSAFYKDFTDPIEQVAIAAARIAQTFENAEGATNQGFEVEIRKSLDFISDNLSSFTGVLNYTFVDSEINIDPATTTLTDPDRPLTGQPDNLINLVLEWAPQRWNTTVRLLFNSVDDTIFLGGAEGLPDVIEEGRETIDLVYLQGLTDRLSLKLTASNLTDEEKLWTQGGESFRVYDTGRSFGISFGYAFQ